MGDKEWRSGCRTPTQDPSTNNRWLSVSAQFEQGCTHAALATWSGATPQTRNPDLAGEQRRRANLCAAREAFCSLGGSFVELQRADAVAIRMKSNPARFPVVRGRRSTDMWPRLRAKGLSLAWLCAGKGKDR